MSYVFLCLSNFLLYKQNIYNYAVKNVFKIQGLWQAKHGPAVPEQLPHLLVHFASFVGSFCLSCQLCNEAIAQVFLAHYLFMT